MPDRFPVGLPLDAAWSRRVLCAAEIVDAVTLEPVVADLKVRVAGLKGRPLVNWGGYHVWLEEGEAKPQRIFVDASRTLYASTEAEPPVPPNKSRRIELAPRYAYPFPSGATAFKGTLRMSRFGTPRPVAGAAIQLQWFGDAGWIDAPTSVTSEDNGDFAAPLRLAPKTEPRMVPGGLAVRLKVTRSGATRTSDEFALPPGRVTPGEQPFNWDDLHS
jgi:hypothetical protein